MLRHSDQDDVLEDQPLTAVLGDTLRVPLVHGGTTRYVNLDQAASTPPLRSVVEHLAAVTPYYSSVHRGAGYASLVSTRMYESARTCVQQFVSARPEDCVIFTRNTTDSLNLLAGCVPGDVLVLDIEHHANLLPWRKGGHRTMTAAPTISATLHALERELSMRSFALVAVNGASNVTGELLPLADLTAIAHRFGARIAVDGAQLVPHRRVDLAESGIDYLAWSGHKMYAPYGAGVLVGRGDWLDQAPAYLAGGGAVQEVTAEDVAWAGTPDRHEAGSPNVLGVVALAHACDQLSRLLGASSQQQESRLLERVSVGLHRHPEVRSYRIWADSSEAIGVLAFSVDGYEAGHVAAYLSAEHGIGVRDGRFCAHPLSARLGIPRTGAVRVSFGLGSRMADADRLITAVDQLLGSGPRWNYRSLEDGWSPVPDPRPTPAWMPQGRYAPRPCRITARSTEGGTQP